MIETCPGILCFYVTEYPRNVPKYLVKKFNRMGSNVLLTSENPSYEPIMLTEGQVSVIGVAVGLIMKKAL